MINSSITPSDLKNPYYFVCTAELLNGRVQQTFAMARERFEKNRLYLDYYTALTPFEEMNNGFLELEATRIVLAATKDPATLAKAGYVSYKRYPPLTTPIEEENIEAMHVNVFSPFSLTESNLIKAIGDQCHRIFPKTTRGYHSSMDIVITNLCDRTVEQGRNIARWALSGLKPEDRLRFGLVTELVDANLPTKDPVDPKPVGKNKRKADPHYSQQNSESLLTRGRIVNR